MELLIKLTVEELNQILQALGQAPYAQVAGLISNLTRQGNSQLNPPVIEEDRADDE